MINGDLFEFWFEWRTVIPRRGFRTLAALADVVDAGVPVVDDRRQSRLLGRRRAPRRRRGRLPVRTVARRSAGWRTHIEHGDGLRPDEDKRYRLLRRVLQKPAGHSLAFAGCIPTWPRRSRRQLAREPHVCRRATGTRAARCGRARAGGANRSLELIVFGHSHVATLERLPSGTIYANPGSWLDAPTFLQITDDASRCASGTAQPRVRISTPSIVSAKKALP